MLADGHHCGGSTDKTNMVKTPETSLESRDFFFFIKVWHCTTPPTHLTLLHLLSLNVKFWEGNINQKRKLLTDCFKSKQLTWHFFILLYFYTVLCLSVADPATFPAPNSILRTLFSPEISVYSVVEMRAYGYRMSFDFNVWVEFLPENLHNAPLKKSWMSEKQFLFAKCPWIDIQLLPDYFLRKLKTRVDSLASANIYLRSTLLIIISSRSESHTKSKKDCVSRLSNFACLTDRKPLCSSGWTLTKWKNMVARSQTALKLQTQLLRLKIKHVFAETGRFLLTIWVLHT